MTTNETVTITETAPDGTETVIEITTTQAGNDSDDDSTLVEEVFEALLDENAENGDYDTDFEETGTEETVTVSANETENAQTEDFAPVGAYQSDGMLSTDSTSASEFVPYAAPAEDASTVYAASETTSEDSAESAAQQAHAEAAAEAQEAADEFVAQGDYAAAAEAREVAENEAWQAGDNSMLGTSDSSDLEYAAYQQENAEYHQEQQAIHAQQGDYEAAREDASNAAYATQDADWYAGGTDHSGQAQAEETQMDWAVWNQEIAEDNAQAAEEYLAIGDTDNAENYAAQAVEHQETADYYGDLGEHGGDMAVYDASSEVASGGSYDASSVADTTTDYSTDYSTE